MEREWLIIPEIDHLEESVELAKKYNCRFEYNDFYEANVYQNKAEIDKRIRIYKSLDRDRSRDTLHGSFKDVVCFSDDEIIRNRGRILMMQSLDIAKELGCKGVVFHTGMIGNFSTREKYMDYCADAIAPFLIELGGSYPELDIYMENSFEIRPEFFVKLMERTKDVPNVKLCLDYAHAMLTGTPIDEWVSMLAPYIGHMHINDNDLKSDLHQIPGTGSIDYLQYKELTEKNGICVSTLIELFGLDAQKQSLEYMNSL